MNEEENFSVIHVIKDDELSLFVSNCCPICLQKITTEKNNCITECGHSFCFSCFIEHCLNHKSNDVICPICRTILFVLKSNTTTIRHTTLIYGYERTNNFQTIICKHFVVFCCVFIMVIVLLVCFGFL